MNNTHAAEAKDPHHIPVLLQETLEALNLAPNANIVDGTTGGGGHTRAILERTAPRGIVIGFDRDLETLQRTQHELQQDFGDRFIPIHDSYNAIDQYAEILVQHTPITGILADLGYSSFQIDDTERGFSFRGNGPLDMRFDQGSGQTAAELLNSQPEEELRRILREYGEVRAAGKLASLIVAHRSSQPFVTVQDLVSVVERAMPRSPKHWHRIHPATQVFQALRIAVNDELRHVEEFLPKAMDALASGGRLAIISFHSLEDRIVKNAFKDFITDCVCLPELPECRCDHRAIGKRITKKPIIPSDEEIEQNPRSRSAKLRVIEKI